MRLDGLEGKEVQHIQGGDPPFGQLEQGVNHRTNGGATDSVHSSGSKTKPSDLAIFAGTPDGALT